MSGSDVVIRGRLRHVLSDVTRDIVICRLTRSVPKRVPPWLNVQWAPNLRPEDDVSLQRQLSCSRVSPRKNDFSLTSKAKTFLAIVEHRQPASSRLSRECNGAVNISRYASGKKKGEKKRENGGRTLCALLKLRHSSAFLLHLCLSFALSPFLRRPFYWKVSAPSRGGRDSFLMAVKSESNAARDGGDVIGAHKSSGWRRN